jgi:glucokinase
MNDDALAIGVDLGATKIATALVSRDGRLIASQTTATHAADGPAAVCDRIAGEIAQLKQNARGKIIGIGVGSPGAIDRERGIVRVAVNLGWDEVRLAEKLRSLADLVIVETDANANAVGEGMFGSAIGCDSYVLFTIGSGLGAGIVSGGRLITGGSEGIAANLGHYALDPDNGRACPCGHRGCAETIVSGPALAAAIEAASADAVVAAARSGDARARGAIETMARALGHVAAVAAAVVDPRAIVIGGGLGAATFDLLVAPAQAEMYRRLPTVFTARIDFRRAGLRSPAIGAASLVFSRESS